MTLESQASYPVHDWQIIEEEFDLKTNYHDETVFALGNGYLGMRGNFEEDYEWPPGRSVSGTYINGFYETEPITYGEENYGYPQHKETMLNVINCRIIKLFIAGEEFNMFDGELIDYQRSLDLKQGVLTREVIWKSPQGEKVALNIKRLVSFTNQHLAIINYEVIPLNFSGEVRLVSALDGAVTNQNYESDPRVGSQLQGQVLELIDRKVEQTFGALIQQTANTRFGLVCGMENRLETECDFRVENEFWAQRVSRKYCIPAQEGEKITLTKYITYHTADAGFSAADLLAEAKSTLHQAVDKGASYYFQQQKEYLADFWQQAEVKIKGDKKLQQGLRFNQFHLLQSVGKDGKTNIAAKGITGEGYEGHYFWDTETYILPFFIYTKPEVSRKLLEYRYNILDKARRRARVMAHKQGALYPWRTISGEECSAYYPAGTAQYHINADISYAVKRYLEATGDIDFLLEYGAEILVETARLWVDLGAYIPSKDNKFCLNEVTGPDEYTALVNNNCYTNYMAQMNLQYAVKMAQLMQEEHPTAYQQLKEELSLEEEEIEEWAKAAENMYLPYNEELGIHPQDDTFLTKKVWDFENTPEENYPLLLHYHPLVIYRHQVCKQADVVLALFLLGDRFSSEDKKRNFDYYEEITTHDSSLSACIYSIMAAEIGYYDKAYDYFMETVRMDLDNHHQNTEHGIHTAAMAGSWLCLVNGFGGMRLENGELKFAPYLPKQWTGYEFKIRFKGAELKVEVDHKTVTYRLLTGKEVEFYHQDKKVKLEIGAEAVYELESEWRESLQNREED